MAERAIDVNIAEQSRQDLQDYAIYVARNRAIPEMVDGLKTSYPKNPMVCSK